MAHWLYPANIKYFDVFAAFEQAETYWPINSKVEPGDIVFIYLAAPYKQIAYKCEVLDTDLALDVVLPHVTSFIKGEISSDKEGKSFMRLKKLACYTLDKNSLLSYSFLKENGLTGMLMGPRKLENNPLLISYVLEVSK